MKKLTLMLSLVPVLALAQGAPPMPPEPPLPPPPPPGMGPMGMLPGIPPHVAQRLGIPQDTVKKVKDLAFDANEQLIGAEADLKRAQLDLERYLSGTAVEEAAAYAKLEAVIRAELAVKKNRIGLMIRIRKLLGPELWQKLEAEMPMPDPAGRGVEAFRQNRVLRKCDDRGTCTVTTCSNGNCTEVITSGNSRP